MNCGIENNPKLRTNYQSNLIVNIIIDKTISIYRNNNLIIIYNKWE